MIELTKDFWMNVQVPPENRWKEDCWLWVGFCRPGSYPMWLGHFIEELSAPDKFHKPVYRKRLRVSVRQLLWIRLKGELPAGMVLRSKCNNRMCVNPFHFWPDANQTQRGRIVDADSYKACRMPVAQTHNERYMEPTAIEA